MKTGIKLVDNILENVAYDDKPDTVSISLDNVILNQDNEPLKNRIKCDVVPRGFEHVYRIMVSPEIFPYVQIICDGNSLDIHTESIDDSRYKVKRKLNAYKPDIIDDEMILEIQEFETTKNFIKWIESLEKDMVEAYRQIYYDRWNFGTGNHKDRTYFDLLDEEYKGRR